MFGVLWALAAADAVGTTRLLPVIVSIRYGSTVYKPPISTTSAMNTKMSRLSSRFSVCSGGALVVNYDSAIAITVDNSRLSSTCSRRWGNIAEEVIRLLPSNYRSAWDSGRYNSLAMSVPDTCYLALGSAFGSLSSYSPTPKKLRIWIGSKSSSALSTWMQELLHNWYAEPHAYLGAVAQSAEEYGDRTSFMGYEVGSTERCANPALSYAFGWLDYWSRSAYVADGRTRDYTLNCIDYVGPRGGYSAFTFVSNMASLGVAYPCIAHSGLASSQTTASVSLIGLGLSCSTGGSSIPSGYSGVVGVYVVTKCPYGWISHLVARQTAGQWYRVSWGGGRVSFTLTTVSISSSGYSARVRIASAVPARARSSSDDDGAAGWDDANTHNNFTSISFDGLPPGVTVADIAAAAPEAFASLAHTPPPRPAVMPPMAAVAGAPRQGAATGEVVVGVDDVAPLRVTLAGGAADAAVVCAAGFSDWQADAACAALGQVLVSWSGLATAEAGAVLRGLACANATTLRGCSVTTCPGPTVASVVCQATGGLRTAAVGVGGATTFMDADAPPDPPTVCGLPDGLAMADGDSLTVPISLDSAGSTPLSLPACVAAAAGAGVGALAVRGAHGMVVSATPPAGARVVFVRGDGECPTAATACVSSGVAGAATLAQIVAGRTLVVVVVGPFNTTADVAVAAAGGCANGVRNAEQGETGVDCGGACPACVASCGNARVDLGNGEDCDGGAFCSARCSALLRVKALSAAVNVPSVDSARSAVVVVASGRVVAGLGAALSATCPAGACCWEAAVAANDSWVRGDGACTFGADPLDATVAVAAYAGWGGAVIQSGAVPRRSGVAVSSDRTGALLQAVLSDVTAPGAAAGGQTATIVYGAAGASCAKPAAVTCGEVVWADQSGLSGAAFARACFAPNAAPTAAVWVRVDLAATVPEFRVYTVGGGGATLALVKDACGAGIAANACVATAAPDGVMLIDPATRRHGGDDEGGSHVGDGVEAVYSGAEASITATVDASVHQYYVQVGGVSAIAQGRVGLGLLCRDPAKGWPVFGDRTAVATTTACYPADSCPCSRALPTGATCACSAGCGGEETTSGRAGVETDVSAEVACGTCADDAACTAFFAAVARVVALSSCSCRGFPFACPASPADVLPPSMAPPSGGSNRNLYALFALLALVPCVIVIIVVAVLCIRRRERNSQPAGGAERAGNPLDRKRMPGV